MLVFFIPEVIQQMPGDTYLTLARQGEGLYKEKGSKFISYAFPVTGEEEIRQILAGIRKEHYSARHCCFAWRLGARNEKYRSNDDGEPSGTAGRPIYGQILSSGLTDVLVVVVRYFGGTLLGTSGLIRAYGQAAADALSAAGFTEKIMEHTLMVSIAYEEVNSLMKLVKDEHLVVTASSFGQPSNITVRVRDSRLEEILNKLGKINGAAIKEEQTV